MSRRGRGDDTTLACGASGRGRDVLAGRLRRSRLVAAWVVLVGVAAALLGAVAVVQDNRGDARTEFEASAAEISFTLRLILQRENDLVVGVRSYIARHPNTTNAQFRRWVDSMSALANHPEVVGIGRAVLVPAADLPAFKQRLRRDPTPGLDPAVAPRIVPSEADAFYCLPSDMVVSSPEWELPVVYDLCAGESMASATATRDTGTDDYTVLDVGERRLLVMLSPTYRLGLPPATVAQRRAQFTGWVGQAMLPQKLFQVALSGHRGYGLRLTYRDSTGRQSFASGPLPAGALRTSTRLAPSLQLETYGPGGEAGILARPIALGVLAGGAALSALLAAVVYLLTTGRTRAQLLLAEKGDELRRQALHDPLTGLPNRALVMDRLDHLLARAKRGGAGEPAALQVDLDGFKRINDTSGHAVGDRLLRAVAARLTSSLRGVDTVGRLGGDEFVILVEGATLESAPELVAERLLRVLREPFALDGAPGPISLTASVGIAAGTRNRPEDLLRDADLAVHQAKAAGRDGYVLFDAGMGSGIRRRYELAFDLRTALDQQQFRLVYQPIFALGTLRMVGVEALLRWQHPSLGAVGPDEFVPLLESTGLIHDVGRWTLREACRQLATWRDLGHDLTVAVNLSGRQLDRDSIVTDVEDALRAAGLDASALVVEITETAVMENIDATRLRLSELKRLGVRVAVDDFGTGYSSLAYLQRLPVDLLKIDRSFTQALTDSAEARVLVHTLVTLGKNLRLGVVAEGVETEEQLTQLRADGVDEAQGFLLARPLEAPALDAELRRPGRRPGVRPPDDTPARARVSPVTE